MSHSRQLDGASEVENVIGWRDTATSLAISSVRRYQQGIARLSCSLVIEPEEPESMLTFGGREASIYPERVVGNQ
jgi:hypothetical protein